MGGRHKAAAPEVCLPKQVCEVSFACAVRCVLVCMCLQWWCGGGGNALCLQVWWHSVCAYMGPFFTYILCSSMAVIAVVDMLTIINVTVIKCSINKYVMCWELIGR